jgi:hypothetical protein
MAKAIRGHNLGMMVAIALVAALLLTVGLVFMVQRATTTGDRVERPAIGADRANPGAAVPGTGDFYGDGWNNYGHDTEHAAGSSVFRDPNIEGHAELVARRNQGTLR